MVGAKYVLLSGIDLSTTVYFEWNPNKNEEKSRPPPVENSS